MIFVVEQHQIQQRKILQVRKEIEGVDKAIMEMIRTLRMAKETLEASLENHDEKMAASTDARLGKQRKLLYATFKESAGRKAIYLSYCVVKQVHVN
jgi:hypothetical protein